MKCIQPFYPISSQSRHNVRLCSAFVLIRILGFLRFTPASQLGSCWHLGGENSTLANTTLNRLRVGGNSSSWIWHQSNFSHMLLGAASIVWFLWMTLFRKKVCQSETYRISAERNGYFASICIYSKYTYTYIYIHSSLFPTCHGFP